ncbi:MAG TPA: hypothetical protein VK669_14975 [Candidatus Limnocylindrales bacterium]|nr:hypothetical protein [Candidatus Limnocylindrales bacterium]
MRYSIPTINSLAFVAYSGARIVLDRFYVTGQPSDPAFPPIAGAGIKSIVCVREPGEAPPPPPVPGPPPFDLAHERGLAEKNHLAFSDIVITRTMTQPEFDVAATEAAFALARNAHQAPALVHCSTGDRASSVFAALLILAGMPNLEASDFAANQLLLASPQILALVQGYRPALPPTEEFRAAAEATGIALVARN